MDQSALGIIFEIIALFMAITFHEFSHAWVANYLGDPTAKSMGRMSLNPLVHIDPFGTGVLPMILIVLGMPPFGYAKPVHINPGNFKNYKSGQALTSLAGPLANLILVLFFTLIYKITPAGKEIFTLFVLDVVVINIVLMVFNLIPIPPLDGSKLLYYFTSHETALKMERYGPILLIPFIIFLAPYILTPMVSLILQVLGIS
jgi:Zn-dependent protease